MEYKNTDSDEILRINITSEYISGGCNVFRTELDWGNNDIIAYGACNNVVLQNPNFKKGTSCSSVNFAILKGNTSPINSVKWVKKCPKGNDELIAVDCEGRILIWKQNDTMIYDFKSFKAHTESISTVAVINIDCPYFDLMIATSCVLENSVKIWKRKLSGDIVCIDTFDFEDNFCCSLKLFAIPREIHSAILLACGMQNHNIILYTSDSNYFGKDRNLFQLSRIVNTLHKDWITSIDFSCINCNNLVVATSSADSTIKIWSIEENQVKNVFSEHEQFKLQLEATLCGHTASVSAVHFSPETSKSGHCRLLSASMDCTILIWIIRIDGAQCIIETGLGKSSFDNLGFLGASFNPTGTAVIAYDHQGNLVMWKQMESNSNCWLPQAVGSGHHIDVVDVRWDPNGQYIVSAGKDKSVRVHCPRKGYSDCDGRGMVWAEFARAQIHGYCMSCVAVLPNCQLVSGSDEKILRSFVAPRKFVETSTKFSYLDANPDNFSQCTTRLQTLNLSADVETTIDDETLEYHIAYNDGVPVSTILPQQTLWPEVCKMYSHTDDVVALTVTSDGCFIASSCKGASINECAIVIWDGNTWKELQKLHAHSLTVTQLEFSPDNRFLLSVGRDRRWTLFKRSDGGVFEKIDEADEQDIIHRRILLCCAWSHDGKYFATGSRDGKLIVWGRKYNNRHILKVYKSNSNNDQFLSTDQIDSNIVRYIDKRSSKTERIFVATAIFTVDKVAVTAASFAPGFVARITDYYLLAIGFADGLIRCLFRSDNGWNDCSSNIERKTNFYHNKQVNKLAFRPQFGRPGYPCIDNKTLLLASGGGDSVLYVHCLQFSNAEINRRQQYCE